MKTSAFSIWSALVVGTTGYAAAAFAQHADAGTGSDFQKSPLSSAALDTTTIQNDPDYQKALEYAPILWFADKEEYFPIMPFFSAFDGVDNNEGPDIIRIDLADPEEIAPKHQEDKQGRASWETLDSLHQKDKQGRASWETLDYWYQNLIDSAQLDSAIEGQLNSAITRLIDSLKTGKKGRIDSLKIEALEESLPKGFTTDTSKASLIDPIKRKRIDSLKTSLIDSFKRSVIDSLTLKRSLIDANKRRIATVFYKIDSLKIEDMKGFLYSDEQFWRRLKDKTKNYLEKSKTKLTVYQYYFYYINDQGLQGHPEDIERIFVFVPANDDFRVVAGVGHSKFVPNNVLFYDKSEIPTRYKSHLHILVELGGHASAPDLKGNGFFEPGVDANWHMENLWGSRDVQAIAGSGAIGRYASWMNFPRDSTKRIFPKDPDFVKRHPDRHYYRLLPVEEFKTLDDVLRKAEPRVSFLTNIKRTILFQEQERDLNADALAKISGDVEKTLKYLELPITGLSVGPSSKIQVQRFSPWRSDLMVETKRITGMKALIHSSYGPAIWSDHDVSRLKFSYPEWRLAWLLRPWSHKPHKIDGVFELHAGVMAPRLKSASPSPRGVLAIYYDTFYTKLGRWLSFYGNVSGMNHPRNLAVGFGISAVPPYFLPPHNTFRRFRLRLGGIYNFSPKNEFLLNIQLGLHWRPIPLTNQPYIEQSKNKHIIWNHEDYGKPDRVFKRHLFRPRNGWGFGLWTDWEHNQTPEFRLSWMVPAWDALPVKLDGVLELHAGRSAPLGNISKKDKYHRWTFALYYERFYGSRIPSWYLSFARENDAPNASNFSFGGGFSLMLPLLCPPDGLPLLHWSWVHLRFGLRSTIARESFQLSQQRVELQLGIH